MALTYTDQDNDILKSACNWQCGGDYAKIWKVHFNHQREEGRV